MRSLLFKDPKRSEIDALRDQLFMSIVITDIDQFRSSYNSLKQMSVDITRLRYEARAAKINLQQQFAWYHEQQMKREEAPRGNPMYDLISADEATRINAFNNEVSPIIGMEFEAAKQRSLFHLRCQVS